jgi:glutaredoxin
LIKVYTRTVCPKCIVAKAMLEDSELEYELINVDKNKDAKQKLNDLGFMAAPIVEHDGKFYPSMPEIQKLIQELK